MADAELNDLFDRVKECFPVEKRALFREPLGETDLTRLAEAFPNGHVRRWFEVTDGQGGEGLFFYELRLLGVQEAMSCRFTGDLLRWVEPWWLPIAGDDCGSWFVIDDRDGQVLAVDTEAEEVDVVAESIDAWMTQLLDGVRAEKFRWHPQRGFLDAGFVGARSRSVPRWLTMVPVVAPGVTTIGLILLGLVAVWFVTTRLSH